MKKHAKVITVYAIICALFLILTSFHVAARTTTLKSIKEITINRFNSIENFIDNLLLKNSTKQLLRVLLFCLILFYASDPSLEGEYIKFKIEKSTALLMLDLLVLVSILKHRNK